MNELLVIELSRSDFSYITSSSVKKLQSDESVGVCTGESVHRYCVFLYISWTALGYNISAVVAIRVIVELF